MTNDNTGVAGIDIGKTKLDLALCGCVERWEFPNDCQGRAALVAELLKRGVVRVGLEASGGYERDIVDALRHAGLDVILFQPRQVRAYAVYRQQRAKTDAIDAGLIAACAAEHGPARDVPDPRITALVEPLRLLGQIEDDIVQLKTRREAIATRRSGRISTRKSAASSCGAISLAKGCWTRSKPMRTCASASSSSSPSPASASARR